MEKWVGYARVSTEEQEEGFSLDAQEKAIRDEATKRGATVIVVFREVASGAEKLRPKLEEAINTTIAVGDALVVWKLDRLTRDVRQCLDIVERLQENQKTLISLTERIDPKTPDGYALLQIMAMFAEWERKRIAERVSLGRELAARSGFWTGGRAPLGYKVVDKKLVVDEEGAKLVRYIFKRYAKGDTSIRKLAQELGMSMRRVNWILRNETYIGKRPIKGCIYRVERGKKKRVKPIRFKPPTVIHVPAPAIIDKKLFFKVQRILDGYENYPRRRGKHWVVGLVYCAQCDTPMRGVGGRRNKPLDYPFRCECKKNFKNLYALQFGVLALLWKLFQASLPILRKRAENDYQINLEAIAQKRRDLLVLFRQGLITYGDLQRELKELAAVERLGKKPVSSNKLLWIIEQLSTEEEFFQNQFLSMPHDLQSYIVRSLLKKVFIDNDQIVGVELVQDIADFKFEPLQLPRRKKKYKREQFLEAIQILKQEGKQIGHRSLAKKVGCSPFAAWYWLKKLQREGLI